MLIDLQTLKEVLYIYSASKPKKKCTRVAFNLFQSQYLHSHSFITLSQSSSAMNGLSMHLIIYSPQNIHSLATMSSISFFKISLKGRPLDVTADSSMLGSTESWRCKSVSLLRRVGAEHKSIFFYPRLSCFLYYIAEHQ